jgi:hypothetical protein
LIILPLTCPASIPGDVIADFEPVAHRTLPNAHWRYPVQQIAHRRYFQGREQALLGSPPLRFGVAVFARILWLPKS